VHGGHPSWDENATGCTRCVPLHHCTRWMRRVFVNHHHCSKLSAGECGESAATDGGRKTTATILGERPVTGSFVSRLRRPNPRLAAHPAPINGLVPPSTPRSSVLFSPFSFLSPPNLACFWRFDAFYRYTPRTTPRGATGERIPAPQEFRCPQKIIPETTGVFEFMNSCGAKPHPRNNGQVGG
jgi:hypothetical protein